jgi:hypothetical protein
MNPEESMRTKRSASARDDAISTSAKVASVAAAIGGWVAGMYAGFNLLVPLLATAVVWFIGRKFFVAAKQPIVAPFCVQGGHLVWMMVGAAMTREVLGPNLVDMVWLAVGLAWLWLKPGKAALCVLAVYQLLALPYNLLQFSHTDLGSTANKVLLVHVIWRCLALFYMARLYYRMSKPEQAS